MEEKERTHHRPSLVWPVILITAGILFLLSNLGVLDINFWDLWRLWPVLLILAGLEIILGRRSALGNIISLILTLVVIGGVVALLVLSPGVIGGSSQAAGEMRIQESLEGVERAELALSFAAGELKIGRLSDSPSLIEGDLDLVTNRKPVWDFERSSGRADMSLGYTGGNFSAWNGRGDDWNIRLSPKASFWLDIDLGAGDATIDLSGLDVRSLQVNTGAGRNTITLPAEGDLSGKITGGVGQLVIKIPEGVAARVRVEHGLGGVNVSGRFDKQGDNLYLTDDWEQNENRVDLEVSVGVGQVTIREP